MYVPLHSLLEKACSFGGKTKKINVFNRIETRTYAYY